MKNLTKTEIMYELSDHLYKILGDGCELSFAYVQRGYCEYIMFEDVILWDSENDYSDFNLEEHGCDNLLDYIKIQFNKYVQKLNKIKFK